MTALEAMANMAALLQTIASLSNSAQQISAVVNQAQKEGRADLTPAEVDQIAGHDLNARIALAAAISNALGVNK